MFITLLPITTHVKMCVCLALDLNEQSQLTDFLEPHYDLKNTAGTLCREEEVACGENITISPVMLLCPVQILKLSTEPLS